MATVIATINLKGGVGKTTTTAALAEFMSAEFGYKVLLVDLDPQTNLTTMMIGEQRWQEVNDRKHTVDALFGSSQVCESMPSWLCSPDVPWLCVFGVS